MRSCKGKFHRHLPSPGAGSDDAQANWTYNYDASLAWRGGQLAANVNDGFRQSGFSEYRHRSDRLGAEVAVLRDLSPGKAATFLQYAAIPLKGIAVDPEDGSLDPAFPGTSGSSLTPRKMSGIAISVIEASNVASRTASVVFDSAIHL